MAGNWGFSGACSMGDELCFEKNVLDPEVCKETGGEETCGEAPEGQYLQYYVYEDGAREREDDGTLPAGSYGGAQMTEDTVCGDPSSTAPDCATKCFADKKADGAECRHEGECVSGICDVAGDFNTNDEITYCGGCFDCAQ